MRFARFEYRGTERLGVVEGGEVLRALPRGDELERYRREDRLELEMEVWLNGVKVGDDTLANMGWSFEELLVYASRGTRLVAGDVVGSGTCGTGCLAELWGRRGRHEPPPLVVGDVVTMSVQGIGTIENRVAPGAAPVSVPRARPPRRRPRSFGATKPAASPTRRRADSGGGSDAAPE